MRRKSLDASNKDSLGSGDSATDGSYRPDRIEKGVFSLSKKAALFILSPKEQTERNMHDLADKLNDKASFFFDIDAWEKSGKSVKEFLGNKLAGRSFQVSVLSGHGDAKGICDPRLRVLFDSRTEVGRSFLGSFRQYLSPGGNMIMSPCFGQIPDDQARANATTTGEHIWVGSNGRVFEGSNEIEPSTDNWVDGWEVHTKPGYWKVYNP